MTTEKFSKAGKSLKKEDRHFLLGGDGMSDRTALTKGHSFVIVLAEADPVHRNMMADLLGQSPGVEVLPVADGLEALDLVRKRKPNMLLTDLFLPQMGGLNLVQRSRQEGMKGCIMIQTNTDSLEVYSAAAQMGADRVMKKPINPQTLLKELEPLRYGLRGHYWELLDRMDGGITHLLGKELTAQCAEQLALKPGASMKVAYLEVAAQSRTSSACVEKNVRKYIQHVHSLGLDFYRKEIWARVESRPPSNKKFFLSLIQAAKIPEKSDW